MATKLKPCPFCGGEATAYDVAGVACPVRIICDECWAAIEGDTEKDAIAAWNRRVGGKKRGR